jgi:hypothetical protein
MGHPPGLSLSLHLAQPGPIAAVLHSAPGAPSPSLSLCLPERWPQRLVGLLRGQSFLKPLGEAVGMDSEKYHQSLAPLTPPASGQA